MIWWVTAIVFYVWLIAMRWTAVNEKERESE